MNDIHELLKFNSIVSFNVYAPTVLGSTYQDVKVKAMLDVGSASMLIDPVALHTNIYPSLPEGTEDDPSGYQYVKVEHPNGSVSVIGLPWIDPDTIKVSGKGTLTVTIADIEPQDRDVVLRALASNGFTPQKVKYE